MGYTLRGCRADYLNFTPGAARISRRLGGGSPFLFPKTRYNPDTVQHN